MIVFLLKSSACLAVFLLFYKLLLEKQRMHTFKRYYLLAALVVSLIIPSLRFVEYVEVPTAAVPVERPVGRTVADADVPIATASKEAQFSQIYFEQWTTVLWTLYGLGVLLFGWKFLLNLWKIAHNIRNNPKLKIDTLINVLLKDAVLPHSFLNYIFLNRREFESRAIPNDVLVHEAAHARQRHSLDVLFVELLQVLFWFNPLIHLAKKSIRLNHEFLADQAVLEQGASAPRYQNTLLAFASSTEDKKHQPSMANAINHSSYSSIKKRFIAMKTRTSKKSNLIRSILILPLFALLLYGFSEREVREVKTPKIALENSVQEKSHQEGATEKQLAQYNKLAKKYNALPKPARAIPSGDLKSLETIYRTMSEKQKAEVLPFPECPDPKVSDTDNSDFEKPLQENSLQEGATKKQIREYNRLAETYHEMLANKGNIHIKKSDVDRLEFLYDLMTKEQRADAEPFPDFPEPPEAPEPPVPPKTPNERTVETNVEVNEQKVEEIIENQEIFDELSHNIYSRPDGTQRFEAMVRQQSELQGHIKAIEEKAVEMAKGERLSEEEQAEMQEHIQRIREQGANMKRHLMHLERQKTKLENMHHKVEARGPSQPPSPPKPIAPKSSLELLEELKEDDVRIIFDGKEISYKEARQLFKKNTFLRIDVRKNSENRPVLEVWTE
ncbi:M56 family metallopeptidase [Pricia sp. S334]|uniref:M56 family metallopeptidase n=1 Tax=Pricia mediterranea TaxID=3076079 RepID=A0ABU3L8N3_9FLAO|nr:M56 family metallopeptidase [Pricia sp. S334]MDT7829422.1 M56 family metallopeptidase [Pricia sp. S334]